MLTCRLLFDYNGSKRKINQNKCLDLILIFSVKGAGPGSEGFSVESLFGIPDPRQRPSSTTFQPIGQ